MVFLTGIESLAGRFLAQKFLEKGYPIKALVSGEIHPEIPPSLEANLTYIPGNLLDIPLLEQHLPGSEYVIHCAYLDTLSHREQDALYTWNVQGTANLLHVCSQLPIQKFCHMSSALALGLSQNNPVIDENTKWQDTDLNTFYAKTRYLAELEVWRASVEGLPTLIMNPSTLLGPGDWEQPCTSIFKEIWQGLWKAPSGNLHCVDVRDLSEITYRLLLSETQNERFLINAGYISCQDLLEHTKRIFAEVSQESSMAPTRAPNRFSLEYWRQLIFGKKTVPASHCWLGQGFSYQSQKLDQVLSFEFREPAQTVEWTCRELIKKYRLNAKR